MRIRSLSVLAFCLLPALAAADVPTDCYRGRDTLQDNFDALVRARPDLVSRHALGTSVGGRPIYAWRVAHHPTNTEFGADSGILVLTAGIHGTELQPPEMLYRFAWSLVHNYEQDAEFTRIVDTTEIWFVPLVNIDNYDVFRTNLNDVDIARNFSFLHRRHTQKSGSHPDSEPETRAVRDLLDRFGRGSRDESPVPIDQPGLYIDVHASRSVTMHAYSSNAIVEHCELPWLNGHFARTVGTRAVPNAHLYGLCRGNIPVPYFGSPVDYGYGERRIPSFTFELRVDRTECDNRPRPFATCDAQASTLYGEYDPGFALAAKLSSAPYRMADGAHYSPGTISMRSDYVRARFETFDTIAEEHRCDPRRQQIHGAHFTVYDRPSPGVWQARRGCQGIAMTATDGRYGGHQEWAEARLPAACTAPGGYLVLRAWTGDYHGPEAVFRR